MYGIVTFHDGINFGAYLQVYALHKYLLRLGIDNEIINYKNRIHWFNEYKCFLYTKNPKKLLSNIIKIYKFRKEQKKFKKTPFFSNIESYQMENYEAIFFGSDEIWNFENPLFGLDLFYFGKGLQANKFIAYAASFGNLSEETIIPEEIKILLSRFSNISVRDENSSKILRKFYSRQVEITLDPTLLYDFSAEEIDCPYDDFIMVYTTGFDEVTQRKVKEYAAYKNKKLISVGYRNKFCNINKIAVGPFEFLGYCKKANEIITSMFHGILFSIKYKKNFCLIIDPYRINKLSLLKILGLENRIRDTKDSLDNILSKNIDYRYVDSVLAREKEKSEAYILNSIRT